ncbi:hypothetical protein NDU88_002130 [Pleurodeles waltl]|uniref:Uncharacterized protein n=1 Tax=Pleurodeles waltl TaxID=8319 RepID=A0AAV7L0F0_PLEWA|nr:hypothetical protein NDU88_002130 [Pleurodeles waltl]
MSAGGVSAPLGTAKARSSWGLGRKGAEAGLPRGPPQWDATEVAAWRGGKLRASGPQAAGIRSKEAGKMEGGRL